MANEQANVAGELLAQLARSPDVYPQGLDPIRQAMLLVGFDANAYRSASFLDDRVLARNMRGAWVRIDQAAAAAQTVENVRPLHFIFHTGHVGSTLVSRLLDETGVVLPLREPLPLRALASVFDDIDKPQSLLSPAQFDALLRLFLRLWGRGYQTTKAVVLKATSSAGRIGDPLMRLAPAARALCLNLRAEPYLATLIAGQNSPIDLRGHGAERMRRLVDMVGVERPTPLHSLSLGEVAAMSWLVESATQHRLVAGAGDRVLSFDFDRFLGDVPGHMARLCAHFGLPADQAFLSGIGQSAALTRYAKAPEHAFTPALRTQILDETRRAHGEEIRKGLAWLEATARTNSLAAAVLQANA